MSCMHSSLLSSFHPLLQKYCEEMNDQMCTMPIASWVWFGLVWFDLIFIPRVGNDYQRFMGAVSNYVQREQPQFKKVKLTHNTVVDT